jgi:hypothetical protein
MDENGRIWTENPSGAAAFGAPAGSVARPWRGGQGLCCRLHRGGTFFEASQIQALLGGCFNVVPPPCRSALPQPFLEVLGGLLQEPGQLPLHPPVVEEVSQGLVAIAPLIGARQVEEESPSPAGAQPVPLAIAHRL